MAFHRSSSEGSCLLGLKTKAGQLNNKLKLNELQIELVILGSFIKDIVIMKILIRVHLR